MGLDLQPRSPLNSVQMPAKEAERNRPTASQSYLHFQSHHMAAQGRRRRGFWPKRTRPALAETQWCRSATER
jgi:hypothetical protein